MRKTVKKGASVRVLLISLGQLNGLILKLLARRGEVRELVVATRDRERAAPILNLARVAAGAEGFYPSIESVTLNLERTEAAAETLRELRPDVTCAAPSLQSWWVLDRIPAEAAEPLRPAGLGAWLVFQLAPMGALMRAWNASGLTSPIIAAPYPDVVNPILATRGLAPTCGVGNLDEMVPKLKWRAAERLSLSPTGIRVRLVAHHAMERYVYRASPPTDEPPPCLVQVQVDGRDAISCEEARSLLLEPYPLPRGLDFHFLTAGSALRLIMAFSESSGEAVSVHIPGLHGLPGGYPVVIQNGLVKLDLPASWTRRKAIEINEVSHRWDGIERIGPDGRVVFTERTAGIMRETLGFDFPSMAFDEVDEHAHELRQRFEEYLRKFNR